jgi:hypothetical protein
LASTACWNAQATGLLPAQTPATVAQGLIETDRRFGTAAAATTAIPGLTAMFAPDVIVQGPTMVHGTADVMTALQANPLNATSRLAWAPVRGGVSADGTHGFTFGYMTLTQADGKVVPLKYLAYWIRRDGQWRVAAYKRRVRPAGEANPAMLAPSLPARLMLSVDGSRLMDHQRSLVAAEKAFSDEAQQIGLGPAFTKHGWPDAMNMGGPSDAGFVIGNDAIGRNIGANSPDPTSPVFWSAEEAIVAPGGDLGVTFGHITPHAKPGAPAQPRAPFFTIWRRIDGVWKYIAE